MNLEVEASKPGPQMVNNPQKPVGSWGCVSDVDSQGQTIWIADAHYDEEDPAAACGGIGASGWRGRLGGPILHLIPCNSETKPSMDRSRQVRSELFIDPC
jgi:hypothetical protein